MLQVSTLSHELDALSPLDGRYAAKLTEVRALFSEAGLMRERVRVECAWLLALAAGPAEAALGTLPQQARARLESLRADPHDADVEAIKTIESHTNHDVKAVEVWLRGDLAHLGATPAQLEWVHFACTSEDINNIAYALLLKRARESALLVPLEAILARLDTLAARHAGVAMLARTHGQAASPTTLGKEMANFAARLERLLRGLERVMILGKMNGAVGNFNAHVAALPEVDWLGVSRRFIASLGLEPNDLTTQIEPHDWIAEYCHALVRVNSVLIDAARDIWGYIALGYFRQRVIESEVGSSTMPHKVNPIDFENAEGNLGVANALLAHFAEKLPLSRWQRDLTDSTVLRNLGVALGHAVLAYRALMVGLDKLEIDEQRIAADLADAWEVLAEAIQTVMRAHGLPEAYNQLKALTRGRRIEQSALRQFIESLPLPAHDKERLLDLTPSTYLGLAPSLARRRP